MGIDRRAVLIAGGAVAAGVAAGVVAERRGWWTPAIIGTPDPDVAIVRYARSTEAALIRAYDTALGEAALAAGGNAERLQAYRAHHLDHLRALGGSERDVSAAPAPGAADAGADPLLPALPVDAAGVAGYFAAAEQQRATLLSTGVRISTAGEPARLLALVVSSETTHAIGWSRG